MQRQFAGNVLRDHMTANYRNCRLAPADLDVMLEMTKATEIPSRVAF
jgi:hypothetical protein